MVPQMTVEGLQPFLLKTVQRLIAAVLIAAVVSTGAAAAPAVAADAPDASTPQRPNVLFIMTDQQRFDGMGCHGGQAQTPNLDRLAAAGVDLRQFYTQAPVCVPSRCNLFTGRYSHSHGNRQNNAVLEKHEVHLFKALKQAGYRLGYIEKNHLLAKEEFTDFDFVDLVEQRKGGGARADYLRLRKERADRLRDVASWASACFHDFDPKVTDAYLSRESAIRFINEAPRDQPFCLCVSFVDPHAPHLALSKYKEVYPLDKIKLPASPAGVLDDKAPRYKIKQEAQGSLRATDEDKRRYLAVYYGPSQ